MAEAPFLYAALTLIIALIAGLIPVFSKIKDNPERLKMMTAIASGIIIASAMLIVIPEGYEIATQEDAHDEDGALAGSIALVLLEVNHGEITNVQAIEEIESLLGGHEDHASHEEEAGHEEEGANHEEVDMILSESVEHTIGEYERGEINATTAIEEIEVAGSQPYVLSFTKRPLWFLLMVLTHDCLFIDDIFTYASGTQLLRIL